MRPVAGLRALAELEELIRRQEDALEAEDPEALLRTLRRGAEVIDAHEPTAEGGTVLDRDALEGLLARSRAVEARCRALRSGTLALLGQSGSGEVVARAYARSSGVVAPPTDVDLRL